jgi:hypothetical protein
VHQIELGARMICANQVCREAVEMAQIIHRHVFTVTDTKGHELALTASCEPRGARLEWRAEIEAPDCHLATVAGESTTLEAMRTQVQQHITSNNIISAQSH